MVSSNASEVENLLENTQLLGKLLGRESRSIVRQVFLRDNAEIATSVLEVCLGLESLMGVQVALKFHMGITGRVVNEDTAATIHIVERISLGSLRQSLRITVALSLILVLFSVGYGVPISQYVSMYSLIYYEQ